MQIANYLEPAKSLLNGNALRMALRAAPLALLAVAAAHANSSFNAPTFGGVALPNCSGATSAGTAPSFGGTPTNGGLGLNLYGSASMTGPTGPGTCTLTMTWQGTGSGSFYGSTGALNSSFTITPPGDAAVNSYNLTVLINGTQEYTNTCGTIPEVQQGNEDLRGLAPRGSTLCSGPISILGQTFSVPSGSLSTWTYEVDLTVIATWSDDGQGVLWTYVPSNSTITLLAQSPPTNVPALTPMAFIMTAMLLLCLAGAGLLRRTSAGGGFPGQPS